MRKASLVHVKAHLSELVDLAEHKGQRVIILRHGVPAAALVPVDVAIGHRDVAPAHRLTDAQIDQLWSGFGAGERVRNALADLVESRSRLDRG
jgi:prevent-host-death family protein